ncbi:MAG TPA: diaminopimelate epimerase [Bacteroidales bacterium]|nr:MAG: diaminopimelate epimerase [Bacteroidetes bacterium GWF2_33_38]OFY75008.1 MAG: diaminopimelate epimerase [Bacteroidetes bacterium RIFOXYA12_FULL_33_9]OFY92308.1 MAG: diaminopimelate epimerase [Bacteroidetes bacterium RIFOXYA2_FULL_33_7]HBF87177.1 diaminopimelate epimerase [Bacteroidales bacterium]
MLIKFYKYHGAGNDFIILDNRKNTYNGLNQQSIEFLCHRHFGVGADGLMLLNSSDSYDFGMKYFNSDGRESTMCGNGGRCIVAFAKSLQIIGDTTTFEAIDGIHIAEIIDAKTVKLKMNDVFEIKEQNGDFILNTGSPHIVKFVENANDLNVFELGKQIRYSKQFSPNGINVNFVQKLSERKIYVRTYERGVENETLSCGTGVTAASIAYSCLNSCEDFEIETKGGILKTSFTKTNSTFTNVWLQGSVSFVFEGFVRFKMG